MRRLGSALFALLPLTFACGSKEQPKDAPKETAKAPETPEAKAPEAPKRSTEEMLQRLWADPANAEGNKTLLAFRPDGSFDYLVFDGQAWSSSPGTYKIEGDTLIDIGSKATYKLTVSEESLTLDNVKDGELDFMGWRPATGSDCDVNAAKAPCPVKDLPVAGAAAPAK